MGNPVKQGRPRGASRDAHPSGDTRFLHLDAAMKRHRFRPDALIEVLHKAQELFGYLEPDLLRYVARGLRLPPSRVYGVATFYHLFTFTPKGEHTCTVCTGTACYVKGADALLEVVEHLTGAHPEKTSPDGLVSLETARCLGTCGSAPLVVIDGEAVGPITPEGLAARVKGWIEHGT